MGVFCRCSLDCFHEPRLESPRISARTITASASFPFTFRPCGNAQRYRTFGAALPAQVHLQMGKPLSNFDPRLWQPCTAGVGREMCASLKMPLSTPWPCAMGATGSSSWPTFRIGNRNFRQQPGRGLNSPDGHNFESHVSQMEKEYLQAALDAAGGVRRRAAQPGNFVPIIPRTRGMWDLMGSSASPAVAPFAIAEMSIPCDSYRSYASQAFLFIRELLLLTIQNFPRNFFGTRHAPKWFLEERHLVAAYQPWRTMASSVTGHEHDLDVRPHGDNLFCSQSTRHLRHHYVCQHQMNRSVMICTYCQGAFILTDFVPRGFKRQRRNQRADPFLIFNHQDRFRAPPLNPFAAFAGSSPPDSH